LLLVTLQQNLNTTYWSVWGNPTLEHNWAALNVYDRRKWGTDTSGIGAPLTDEELKIFAQFHYPVYAFGYNWLKSNEISAQLLQSRIEKIIEYWTNKKRECNAVILVTHSMGGLVARACAKNIPQLIAGVIHGVMPALGAPVCYRRLACGAETSSPSNDVVENLKSEKIAEIAGFTIAETTPVLSVAAGPLELLPNHLYPKPWLFAQSTSIENKAVFSVLSVDNPYTLYADFIKWYGLIDPAIADPAHKHKGSVSQVIVDAIRQAKKFHTEILNDYYHPKTFAFYCNDESRLSYGSFRWKISSAHNLSSDSLSTARLTSYIPDGGRKIEIRPDVFVDVMPSMQDVPGDGTVPIQSGAALVGKIKHVFATDGYSHQDCFSSPDMLSLTQHLIVKLMQEV
jgi:pimeloyl-ACP methyl ester carboxylesterase